VIFVVFVVNLSPSSVVRHPSSIIRRPSSVIRRPSTSHHPITPSPPHPITPSPSGDPARGRSRPAPAG
jgi:hypothetical protein